MSSSRVLRIIVFSLGVAGLMILTLRISALSVVGARCFGLEPLGWSAALPSVSLVMGCVYLVLRNSGRDLGPALRWTPFHTLSVLSPGLIAFAFIHLNSGPASGLIEARQRFTIEAMLELDAEMRSFVEHERRLPEPGELARKAKLRRIDGWKHLLEIELRDDNWAIVCRAHCNELDLTSPFKRSAGSTTDPRADIILLDGELISWPAGMSSQLPVSGS